MSSAPLIKVCLRILVLITGTSSHSMDPLRKYLLNQPVELENQTSELRERDCSNTSETHVRERDCSHTSESHLQEKESLHMDQEPRPPSYASEESSNSSDMTEESSNSNSSVTTKNVLMLRLRHMILRFKLKINTESFVEANL